jgi:PAS domain S-box-containing protein
LLGWTREDMIGKTDFDFFPARQARSFIADDKKVITNKMLVDVPDEPIHTKHKGKRILHTIKIPILNNEGEAVYLLGISEDITEKREYENTLKESEKMYRAMLNASPSGIIIMNTKGQITEISDIILEIFGIENKAEFMGAYFHQLFPAKEEKKIKSILSKTRKEGLVQNIEYVLTRKNKSRYICEISTTLIQDAQGHAKGFMGIVRDISQRKKIEQQLIRSERLVSLGEMASAMAHEINQPLLSITLGIENLLMKMQPANDSEKVYFHDKSEKYSTILPELSESLIM